VGGYLLFLGVIWNFLGLFDVHFPPFACYIKKNMSLLKLATCNVASRFQDQGHTCHGLPGPAQPRVDQAVQQRPVDSALWTHGTRPWYAHAYRHSQWVKKISPFFILKNYTSRQILTITMRIKFQTLVGFEVTLFCSRSRSRCSAARGPVYPWGQLSPWRVKVRS
jgi:hypothetical protein